MRRLWVLLKNIFFIPFRLLFTNISVFAALQNSTVHKKAAICSFSKFYRSEIGKYSYVGTHTFITNTHIGNFTSISGNCYIGGTCHPLNWVSSSPVFHKWENILHTNFAKFEYDIFQETYIGNDVWIVEACKIKAGVHIADGAVIGMGSVLTKDVGPYEIWAGNPAKLIRKRFDDETIEKLLNTRWWNFDEDKVFKYAKTFNNPNEFLTVFEKNKDEL